MTPDEVRRLAFAPDAVFERAADAYTDRYLYARERTALLCTGCRLHKPREEFRETPWHGRAAACKSCETFPGPAGRSLWQIEYDARMQWQLEQTRQKLRAYQRYVQALRRERYDGYRPRVVLGMGQDGSSLSPDYSSAYAFEAYEAPYKRALEARRRKWAPLVSEALSKAHTLSEEDFK